MHLRGLLGTLAPAVLAGALVAVPQAAQASVGVGIQAGAVRLSGAAHPGQSIALPGVSVVNSGTHPESIRLSVQRLSKGSGRVGPGLLDPVRLTGRAARAEARRAGAAGTGRARWRQAGRLPE